ncbi:MAG TPA: inorganic pyrophosphatase [Ktedonobacteraceae bacterium]
MATSQIKIDRPKGSAHPRYPEFFYPIDYGYLEGTVSGDGQGIDLWIGTLPEKRITAMICTVDLAKRDSEIKLLLACTKEEIATILASHQIGSQSATLLERP